MTERVRRGVHKEVCNPTRPGTILSARPGIEGYADAMRVFPRLQEWENQIALKALREGKTVDALQQVTPFRQYLDVAKRAAVAGESSPFSTFTSLFGVSESIDMLASYGNFYTIRTWTWTLAQRYPDLHLPKEPARRTRPQDDKIYFF